MVVGMCVLSVCVLAEMICNTASGCLPWRSHRVPGTAEC